MKAGFLTDSAMGGRPNYPVISGLQFLISELGVGTDGLGWSIFVAAGEALAAGMKRFGDDPEG